MLGSWPLLVELAWSYNLPEGEIDRPGSLFYAFTKQHSLIISPFVGHVIRSGRPIFRFHLSVYLLLRAL